MPIEKKSLEEKQNVDKKSQQGGSGFVSGVSNVEETPAEF